MPGLPRQLRDEDVGDMNREPTVDRTCHKESSHGMTPEEKMAAEETLAVYCKPVEFYNVIRRRAMQNPSFLQRCLLYKKEAKRNRRIQMMISLSETVDTGLQVQSIFPLYVLLARPVSAIAAGGHSAAYCLTRPPVLTTSSELERDRHEANLILPEIDKLLADITSSKLTILLVSCDERQNSLLERNLMNDHSDATSIPSNVGGYRLWAEIPMESLNLSSPEKGAKLSSVDGAEILKTVNMRSCFLESSCLDVGSFISSKTPGSPVKLQVQVKISAQVVGAKESFPYSSYAYEEVPNEKLSCMVRLRSSTVCFNYKYYNNKLHKWEVTGEFACPFCLVKCASFKGLGHHLCACHDLFHYEFLITEECQGVNVSVKSDSWISEAIGDFDPRVETFTLRSKARKRRRSKNLSGNQNHIHEHFVRSGTRQVAGEGFLEGLLEKEDGASCNPMPNVGSTWDTEPSNQIPLQRNENGAHSGKERERALQNECAASSPNVAGACTYTAHSPVGLECLQQGSGSNVVAPSMLQFAKTRRLSVDPSDPRNLALLKKRQFFHSQRAQPMEMDQVLIDMDSEDEVDDDIADLEDRRMLDDFVDVTKDEKRIMHLWNSFVRRYRVLADSHIPWAYEAFSRMHAPELVRSPSLMWCWRLAMIKLWNHSLLDARTMDTCNKILQEYECGKSRSQVTPKGSCHPNAGRK